MGNGRTDHAVVTSVAVAYTPPKSWVWKLALVAVVTTWMGDCLRTAKPS